MKPLEEGVAVDEVEALARAGANILQLHAAVTKLKVNINASGV